MRILVTGANGFIGSYISYFLCQRGYYVIASARDFHPSTKSLLQKAKLISLDVLKPDQLNSISLSADCIIHTSTANDIISKNSAAGIELSAIGTKNILDFAVRNNIAKCMVFSTLQVYGTELSGKIDEGSPLLFLNDYGLNHVYAELMAEMYSRQEKIQCISVRPSNVYGRILTGSFNRWSLVPGCFCKEAMEFGTITLKSSGKQMRNFINLENLSNAIESILQHFPPSYEIYNLASSQTLTMVEMAEKVKAVFEKKFKKTVKISIQGTIPQTTNFFSVDLTKLKQIDFQESESITLEIEIAQIFDYLQTNNNEPNRGI